MGGFRELTEMSRDFGLGGRYFLLVAALLAALLSALFLWGRVEDAVPAVAPSAATTSPSY
jgi:hypothetical protein